MDKIFVSKSAVDFCHLLSEGLWFEPLPFIWIPLIALFTFFNFFHSYIIINNEFFEQR